MSSVLIYTTPTCAFCHMAKEYFKSKDIEFDTKDITQDKDAYQEILDKSDQLGTPVIDIDGIVVIGFNRNEIDAALKEKQLV